ncbi:MAG: dihydrolipoamide acetyltransferase family protein, partial [Candidatus Dormibacteria bacterium]
PAAAGEAQGEPSANGARAREEAATGTRGLESAPSPWAEFKGGQDRGAEPGGSRVKASPLARRRARELGVELAALHASGPGGRIRAEDVEAATRQGTARSPARAAGPGPVPDAEDPGRPLELTRMREAIARRMAESNSTIPHFHLSTEVDMGDLLQLRGQLNELGEAGLPRFSVTDFLVRALALTLQQHRELNAAWMGQGVRQFNQSNIALAVALPGGLVAPVLRACESRSFSELARRTHDLVARAKEGKLRPEELSGGHAAISNLGMFGVSRFNAIISPGHGSVLAVGEVRPEAVVREGQLTVGRRMSLTLGIDHRVTDGAVAAEALAYLRWLLEHPSRCLL